jgi:predicted dehydrogenase
MAVERQNLAVQKMQMENQPKEEEVQPNFDQQPEPKPPSDKARKWAEANSWFNTDRAMTYTAMEIHKDLVQEGFDVEADDYYNEINQRIRSEFPHKFEENKPRQKVASAIRTSSTGRRTVKLTPSQVAIAKKLGVPLEEYARHVKEA